MSTFALTLARRLVARGISVFPVPYAGDGLDGKTPVRSWKRYQTELPTDAELESWFAIPQNVAIVTGWISGVVVVDVDQGAGWEWAQSHLPETPWRTLTARGVHLLFGYPGVHVPTLAPPKNSDRGRLLPVDIRGDGGYAMAPGSIHESGAVYQFAGDWRVPREQLPRFSLDWLPPAAAVEPRVTKQERRPSTAADVLTRARAYLSAVPRPEIGCGSDLATFTAACRLVRGFALGESEAENLLWQWAGSRPGWDRRWIALKVRSARDNGKELIGALL